MSTEYDRLCLQRAACKDWMAEHTKEDDGWQEKKDEAKVLKTQIRALEAEMDDDEEEDEKEAAPEKKKSKKEENKKDAADAEDADGGDFASTVDLPIKLLNEWKVASGHSYKTYIAPIVENKKSPEEEAKKKKKGKQENPSGFRATLTALPKKTHKNNMFSGAEDGKVDLATEEAPVGLGQGPSKLEAKRAAAHELVAALRATDGKWGPIGSAGDPKKEKNSRFKKFEAAKPKALNMAEESEAKLHPCLRVWGSCTYEEGCQFALFPYNTCLSFLKGKCKHAAKCVEPHDVDVNDAKYQNDRPKKRPTQCFKCGEKGHMTKECPQGSGSGCFTCGEKGHMGRDCPNKARAGRGGRVGAGTGRGGSSTGNTDPAQGEDASAAANNMFNQAQSSAPPVAPSGRGRGRGSAPAGPGGNRGAGRGGSGGGRGGPFIQGHTAGGGAIGGRGGAFAAPYSANNDDGERPSKFQRFEDDDDE